MIYIVVALIVILGVGVFDYLWLKNYGQPVPAPIINREVSHFGSSGGPIRYLMMGDSTAAAQGGNYDNGIALSTARHLAKNNRVSFLNTAVSGARTQDILSDQLTDGLKFKPDIVMVVVGANDVTHLTSADAVYDSISGVTKQLLQQNCNIKIILTGSAAMGSVPRIPHPLRLAAGWRTEVLNSVFSKVVKENSLTFAPIARDTGPIFAKNRSLFAADNFHPNDKGYKIWVPVLSYSLDEAINNQLPHCSE